MEGRKEGRMGVRSRHVLMFYLPENQEMHQESSLCLCIKEGPRSAGKCNNGECFEALFFVFFFSFSSSSSFQSWLISGRLGIKKCSGGLRCGLASSNKRVCSDLCEVVGFAVFHPLIPLHYFVIIMSLSL